MIFSDRHTHTKWSDGHNTPEEMIEQAIRLGIQIYGISDHSYTSCDESYCMKRENIIPYQQAVNRLKGIYEGKIELQLGIEQDHYGDVYPEGFDYVIGSQHYINAGGEIFAVDDGPEELKTLIDTRFDGSAIAFAEQYYKEIGTIAEDTGCDMIGHFNYCSVFTSRGVGPDETDPLYRKYWQQAVDRICRKKGIIFEVNTGGAARGYRNDTYPSREMIDYIREKGGRFELTSDAHVPENIAWGFEKFRALV